MENKNLSLGIDELDLDVRTFNAFKRAGINTVEDYLNCPDKEKLRSVVGNRNFEKFLAASKPAELPTVQPERAAEVSESFNYAVLTAELGDYLKHMEEKLRNEYMNFTANCGRIFAEAQEKLAKHGFGENNGVFEKWITAMGFNKQTVYNMISVHNYRSSKIFTNEQAQLFDSLSKSLQYEVAKPSAPPKLVEQVMNGDITTHKEYIRLKKELEEAQAKIEKLNREADEADREYDAMADRECHYETEICELEQRIKELENRPVDVAIQTDDSLLKEKDQEISEMKEQIERMSDKTVKSFVIRMSLDECEQLIKALEQADDQLKNIIKNARILKI